MTPMGIEAVRWHRESAGQAAVHLRVTPEQGLTEAEAARRLAEHGLNLLPEGGKRGPLAMFLGQFTDFMILVLVAAAVVSGLVGDPQDSIAIVVIVVLNAVIGFTQEYRAEHALAALRRLSAPRARVRRAGHWRDLDAVELVPGDVVWLEAGNLLPADVRLSETSGLRVDESALTGESQPVDKIDQALPEDELALADRRNMAFCGTLVVYGRGIGLVTATGAATELGRIATLLARQRGGQTPLQRRLADFGRRTAWAVLGICGLLFVVGLMRGESAALMFLTAVSLAVAAIPEALPAVVTIALAMGARRMVQSRALVRRLPAVETLGSVTYICSDKTGTLTRNRMHLERVWQPEGADAGQFWQALALNNDCLFDRDGRPAGDPTEVALFRAAQEAGWDKRQLEIALPRVAELPFDSRRKRMSTVHPAGPSGAEGYRILVKGAPESVLPCCDGEPDQALGEAEAMAAAGLRVLAFAWRPMAGLPDDFADMEKGLVFLGLAGLMDPPRAEAKAAVAECRSAGIATVMITGDHPATAAAIARALGIMEGGQVISGRELAAMEPREFQDRVADIRVYARVDPEQKIRIVEALQARGEYVAMTGDGVNDAPALKRADIGVAMGEIGTDVAREAADMVLLDDNFAGIVGAVREGRRIYDNIRRFVRYVLACNLGEILTLFLAPLLGMPLALTPLQLLWVNLVTDGLPGLALTAEPAERGVMRRPARPPAESLLADGLWQHVLWVGGLIGGLCLVTEALFHQAGDGAWQSMVFTVLTLTQMGVAMAVRSERESLFSLGLASNVPLLLAVLLTVLLQMAVLYVPALNAVFHTVPLSVGELAYCFAVAFSVFVAVEVEKALLRHGRIKGNAD